MDLHSLMSFRGGEDISAVIVAADPGYRILDQVAVAVAVPIILSLFYAVRTLRQWSSQGVYLRRFLILLMCFILTLGLQLFSKKRSAFSTYLQP